MANMLANFGLEFLEETDNVLMGFVGHIAEEGKAVQNYYGCPYFFLPMGNSEFWLKTQKKDEKNYTIDGFDTHCGNTCVWEVVHSGFDITPKDMSKLGKVILFNYGEKPGGLIPIEVLTADVLPSLMKDDKVKIQVTALPLDINYFKDEDAYSDSLPKDENGKTWGIATGSLMPISFLYNHAPDRYEQGKDYESDLFVQFTAVVERVYHGLFELNGEKHKTFIRCFADTQYGKLEFDHTLDQVPEEQRENICEGAIISGTCILSGDVAIYDYEKGVVKDFTNNLRLLRYTLEGGDPERLKCVLAEEATLISDVDGSKQTGAQEIIERFAALREQLGSKSNTFYATITDVDDENLRYSVGTRCIAIADSETGGYKAIAFLFVDEDGLIARIEISTDERYHFQVDQPEQIKTPLDDINVPDSVFEPIILRARFEGIIDCDLDESEITSHIEDYYSFEENAQRMLDALQEKPQEDVEHAFANIFGYLFAKAIEVTVNNMKDNPELKPRNTASFYPSEAFAGEISSSLSQQEHIALERAMKLGTQFYRDFKGYIQLTDAGEDRFVELFKQAAVVVQRLGQLYTERCFKKD